MQWENMSIIRNSKCLLQNMTSNWQAKQQLRTNHNRYEHGMKMVTKLKRSTHSARDRDRVRAGWDWPSASKWTKPAGRYCASCRSATTTRWPKSLSNSSRTSGRRTYCPIRKRKTHNQQHQPNHQQQQPTTFRLDAEHLTVRVATKKKKKNVIQIHDKSFATIRIQSIYTHTIKIVTI